MATLREACLDAFKRNDHKKAVLLLRLQIPPILLNQDAPGLLYYSISNGWLDVTRDLVSGYSLFGPPYECYYNGLSYLYIAAKGNHVDIVEYLIKEYAGCDPMMNTSKTDRVPVLHFVASAGLLDVLKCMVMNINGHIMDEQYRTTYGQTVLHRAVKHMHVLKYLINECSCDIITPDKDGDTILHDASGKGLLDVMKYLINTHHCNLMTTNNNGQTVLHLAVKHINVVKYLIYECNCDIMATDKDGQTPLHYAARLGTPGVVKFFLSTGNCDPLAKDIKGRTPLQLAKERLYVSDTIVAIFKKFGNVKISHPIDSYVNVLLVGNPGAGKSTLSHVINDTATGPFVLGSFRNVGGVVPCTAGIIPYKIQHRTLGNIILHDFAGHSEYYSSHSAVIENLLQGSGGVFLIVVNILEKEAVKQLHQWLTVVRNEAQKALNQCHVIVIVSHVDEISNPVERRRKEEIQEIIVRERRDVIGEVMSAYKESCPSLEVNELVIDPKELTYPVNTPRRRTVYDVYDLLSATKEGRSFLVSDKGQTELKEVLPDESLSDISNLSLLGGRDIKEVIEITEEFKISLTPIKLIDIKDLDIVVKELTSDQHLPCSVWHALGLQLGLYDDRLKDIKADYHGQSVECFRECMSAWLRGEDKVREKGGPSWSSLATALDTIEEKSIASYIKAKYCT
uniref:Death domain-containing protein n=1 Tax=Amphimedon queenslandica TaxID=400682 RepID=A0A1X7T6M5_AMPQE